MRQPLIQGGFNQVHMVKTGKKEQSCNYLAWRVLSVGISNALIYSYDHMIGESMNRFELVTNKEIVCNVDRIKKQYKILKFAPGGGFYTPSRDSQLQNE